MSSFSVTLLIILACANLALLIVLLFRRPRFDEAALRPQFDSVVGEARRVEQSLRDEFSRLREESGRGATSLRSEVETRINSGMETLLQRQAEARQSTDGKLEVFRGTLEGKLREFGDHADTRWSRLRQEQNESLGRLAETLNNQFEKLRATLDGKLGELQAR